VFGCWNRVLTWLCWWFGFGWMLRVAVSDLLEAISNSGNIIKSHKNKVIKAIMQSEREI
jgi:hypothetical protein